MKLLDLIPGGRMVQAIVVAAVLAALIGGVTWAVHSYNDGLRQEGRAEVQTKWDAAKLAQANVDLQASQENAVESTRRLAKQQENQNAQNEQLVHARADAERNGRERDQLRRANETAAEQWSRALADSPSRADVEAASDAIRVCTDVLGRADRRASVLAETADARGAAGLKCERDYDALTPPISPPTTER